MDKKLNILLIPHIIFWKMINQNGLKLENGTFVQGQEALQFILETQKKFIQLATSYLVQSNA